MSCQMSFFKKAPQKEIATRFVMHRLQPASCHKICFLFTWTTLPWDISKKLKGQFYNQQKIVGGDDDFSMKTHSMAGFFQLICNDDFWTWLEGILYTSSIRSNFSYPLPHKANISVTMVGNQFLNFFKLIKLELIGLLKLLKQHFMMQNGPLYNFCFNKRAAVRWPEKVKPAIMGWSFFSYFWE